MASLDFTKVSSDEWLRAIPSYQASIVTEMLKSKSFEEAAESWLSSSGPESNAVFGSIPVGRSLFQNVRIEIIKLICDDPEYDKIRTDAAKIWDGGKTPIISLISAVVALKIGVAAVVITPGVALLMATASKIGANAWCASQKA